MPAASVARRRLLIGGLAVAVTLSSARTSEAGDNGDASRPPVRLRLMLNDVAPYSWRKGEALLGMHVELMRALTAELTGPELVWHTGPYVRLSRALRDGAADLVVALEGPDLDAQGELVSRLHAVRMLILPRQGLTLQRLPQLHGRLLGVARGAFYGDSINGDAEIRKYELQDPFIGVRMLAAGRLDAVISSEYLLTHALKQEGIRMDQFGPPLVYGEAHYALYARRELDPELLERLRAARLRLSRSGRLQTLMQPYEN